MNQPLDRAQLRELLSRPNLHDFVDAADRARQELHSGRTSFVATGHLDADSGRSWCPLTGEIAPANGFCRGIEDLPDSASDLVILVPDDASPQQLEAAWALLPPRPDEAGAATVQMGTTDHFIAAAKASGESLEAYLKSWRERGLRSVGDGLRPLTHPVHGAHNPWSEFWRAAAAAGLRGHASVLFGPHHGLDDVFSQIDLVAELQRESEVFLSVSPVIFDPAGGDGPNHALSTHASLDLRVMAACRLALPQVPHLTLHYNGSDLKSAHTALLCGIDDLSGHLFLGDRDRKADAEAQDLSFDEMVRWLEEAGFEPFLRNALFETVPLGSSA